MSQDLTRRQKPLEYLKQRDLRQSIGYTGEGRLRNSTENPGVSASHCQPRTGRTTQEGAVTAAQGLELLNKVETTADLLGLLESPWSHSCVGTLPKEERGKTLLLPLGPACDSFHICACLFKREGKELSTLKRCLHKDIPARPGWAWTPLATLPSSGRQGLGAGESLVPFPSSWWLLI